VTEYYSVLKWIEGGPDARLLVWRLKHAGLKARLTRSVYVGHTGIAVTGGRRAQQRARTIIFGRVRRLVRSSRGGKLWRRSVWE
jgi:hypothetical protein